MMKKNIVIKILSFLITAIAITVILLDTNLLETNLNFSTSIIPGWHITVIPFEGLMIKALTLIALFVAIFTLIKILISFIWKYLTSESQS
ncbi:hypothetical protein [Chondrinema litorale]|uniref:hypothetical protein n=1 Tax=Chondrinema litorale TaxID=2994555 RepID=UPI0025437A9C|nr:hypothetical protein [Chondrinema litorale]UZR94029.1 hypothetical protein OQ292_19490 [Chondrinema litorale]